MARRARLAIENGKPILTTYAISRNRFCPRRFPASEFNRRGAKDAETEPTSPTLRFSRLGGLSGRPPSVAAGPRCGFASPRLGGNCRYQVHRAAQPGDPRRHDSTHRTTGQGCPVHRQAGSLTHALRALAPVRLQPSLERKLRGPKDFSHFRVPFVVFRVRKGWNRFRPHPREPLSVRNMLMKTAARKSLLPACGGQQSARPGPSAPAASVTKSFLKDIRHLSEFFPKKRVERCGV